LHILTNFRKQLAWAERFRHIVIAASRPRNPLFSVERIGGDCDNRDRSQRGIGFDPPRGGVTVHNRQLDIHKDQIRPLLCYGGERLRPVVWLTTQETAVLREADVAHIKSCPQRLEDWRGEGREPEAGAPNWPDRTERVTVKLQRDDRRLVRCVDFLRRLGGEEYARGFEQELSPSSRAMWWVYLGKIPPRKLSPITVAQGRVGLQIQIVLHGHEGHKRLLEAMRDADPGRLVTWDLNDDEAA